MPKKTKGARLTAPKKKTAKKQESPWVQHVRMCMDKYGITYRQAVTDTTCRRLYYYGHE
jgi:hypothetical protein